MKAILTKYHGATDTRGARITASDCDGNRCSVPYDHSLNADGNHRAAAAELCLRFKWHGQLVSGGLGNKGTAHVWVDDPYTV